MRTANNGKPVNSCAEYAGQPRATFLEPGRLSIGAAIRALTVALIGEIGFPPSVDRKLGYQMSDFDH
jgi:hypothetical protein